MYGGLIDSGRNAARAEDSQGTPAQSRLSPSILVYEDITVGGGTGGRDPQDVGLE